jgi:hypothetical protein
MTTKPQHTPQWTPEPWPSASESREESGLPCDGAGYLRPRDYERARQCVNLLALHPDLSSIEILPAGTVERVRKALEDAAESLLEYGRYGRADACTSALALLPAPAAGEG